MVDKYRQIISWSPNSLNIKSVFFRRELTFKLTIDIWRSTCLELSGPGFDWTSRHIRIRQGNTTNKYELLLIISINLADMFFYIGKILYKAVMDFFHFPKIYMQLYQLWRLVTLSKDISMLMFVLVVLNDCSY